jgi:Ca2+-binding RTX toxin-like protein
VSRQAGFSGQMRLLTLAALVLMALPATAQAATVSVSEEHGAPNKARLTYRAVPGEANALSIIVTGEETGYYALQVTDPGAPVEPGSGCSGGGPAGTPATCRLHRPLEGEYRVSAKIGPLRDLSTAWETEMTIDLGDGGDSLVASHFIGENYDRIDFTVNGGEGDDSIGTGGGEDVIDPGYGADVVHTGGAYDRVLATPTPDGPDLYELGAALGEVNYARRIEPVLFSGTQAGAAGEGDTIVAAEASVVGGAGVDHLSGGPGSERLEGGEGDDHVFGGPGVDELLGGPGADELRGEGDRDYLVGDSGDDMLFGGTGEDWILDRRPITTLARGYPQLPPATPGPSGDDFARGEGGDDLIALAGGDDRAAGDAGRDGLGGGAGDDVLHGGLAADRLIGNVGFDHLLGGDGEDVIFSGRTHPYGSFGTIVDLSPAKDDGPDFVGCGGEKDIASVNPWDRRIGCEVVHTLRPRPKR